MVLRRGLSPGYNQAVCGGTAVLSRLGWAWNSASKVLPVFVDGVQILTGYWRTRNLLTRRATLQMAERPPDTAAEFCQSR